MRRVIVVSTLVALLISTGADSREAPAGPPPAIVQGLLACRSISDSAQRLACYDRASGAVAQAIQKRDLVMFDRERATAAKRSLFGFSVPSFAGLLGGGDLNEIEGTVAAARQNGDGGWTIQLADGSVWTQTDGTPIALEPRRGDKVVVRRGTLGSYYVKLGKQPGYKAKRVG
jgi:hypothetical protein